MLNSRTYTVELFLIRIVDRESTGDFADFHFFCLLVATLNDVKTRLKYTWNNLKRRRMME